MLEIDCERRRKIGQLRERRSPPVEIVEKKIKQPVKVQDHAITAAAILTGSSSRENPQVSQKAAFSVMS